MSVKINNQDSLRKSAREAALRGLDFFVRNQVTNCDSADKGRFPYIYNCHTSQTVSLTTSWITGVVTSSLLVGYKFTGNSKYLEAATAACSYIKSLQDFYPGSPRVNGGFREDTPQSVFSHPRDALTAAWALLDYSLITDDKDSRSRAILYGNWFVKIAMEKGYPYWTVRFDEKAWEPGWCGSFHSGSAFFMYRLFAVTGDERYLKAMRYILDFYNKHHMDEHGNIIVVVDRETKECLDGKCDPAWAPAGWQMMHRYNDDFGALANLAAWKVTGETVYRDSAAKFFNRMCASQHESGGFGPKEVCVPSAGGPIVLEMMAAKQLGLSRPEYDKAIASGIDYLLKLQHVSPDNPSDGAFFGMSESYVPSTVFANARAAGYATMGLLRYASAIDNIYFFE